METTELRGNCLLYFIGSDLKSGLSEALQSNGFGIADERSGDAAAQEAELIFCPCEQKALIEALLLACGRPVVVVSRLPDVNGWLDALEAGAADYVAAPFESVQIRWLMCSHGVEPRKTVLAAAA